MKKLFTCILFLSFLVLPVGCSGMTPLMNAAKSGDITIAKDLLDKGADANTKDANGDTAFIVAARNGHTEIVKLLLEKGADVNAKNNGHTALGWAAVDGHTEIVKLLLEKDADVDSAIYGLKESASRKLPYLNNPNYKEAYDRNNWAVEMLNGLKFKQVETKTNVSTETTSVPVHEKTIVKSDIDDFPATKAKSNRNAFAIVIGIENYRQKLPKADFATGDAKLLREYLTKTMGYPEENVITLMNEQATKSDFEKYLEEWLPKNFDKNGSLFFYYSGHGAPNPRTGDAFLVPYDGDPNFIEKTGYPLKKLYENLSMLQAKEVIVVLDSCFSGAGGRSVLAEGSRPLVMNMPIALASAKNMIIMAASSGSEISSSYKDKGHGLFTYFLLKGIKGEADANEDGRIDVEELYQYLKPQVQKIARRLYNNEQTQQLIAAEPALKGIVLQK